MQAWLTNIKEDIIYVIVCDCGSIHMQGKDCKRAVLLPMRLQTMFLCVIIGAQIWRGRKRGLIEQNYADVIIMTGLIVYKFAVRRIHYYAAKIIIIVCSDGRHRTCSPICVLRLYHYLCSWTDCLPAESLSISRLTQN